jgi:hypothetical protein
MVRVPLEFGHRQTSGAAMASLVVFRGAMIVGLLSFLLGCGETFRESQDYFTTKKSRVIVVKGADPTTFRYMKSEYARDKAQVYFEGVLFPVKDVDTFELLDYGFARDRVSGYYHQRPVPEGPDAKDRQYTYREGRRLK